VAGTRCPRGEPGSYRAGTDASRTPPGHPSGKDAIGSTQHGEGCQELIKGPKDLAADQQKQHPKQAAQAEPYERRRQ
jgi:hypothetical protein